MNSGVGLYRLSVLAYGNLLPAELNSIQVRCIFEVMSSSFNAKDHLYAEVWSHSVSRFE